MIEIKLTNLEAHLLREMVQDEIDKTIKTKNKTYDIQTDTIYWNLLWKLEI